MQKVKEQIVIKKLEPKLRFKEFVNSLIKCELNDVVTFKSGGTPPKGVASYWNGNIPWISASSMQGKYYSESERTLSNEGLKNGSKLASTGTLLLLVRGSMLFKNVPIGIASKDVAFNQDLKALIPNHKSKSEFIYQWFLSKQNYLLNKVTGTGIGAGKLDTDDLKSLRLNLPSLHEQQKIASFLSAVDEKIKQLAIKKELLEEYKKGVMQKLFSQQIRFTPTLDDVKHLTSKGILVDLAANYPDWEEKILDNILKRTSTGLNPRKNFTLGSGNNYYVTIKNISNGKLDFRSCEKIDDEAMKLIRKRSDLSKNDLIMSSIGNVGEAFLLEEDPLDWNINESVFMLRASDKVSPRYLYYIITNDFSKWYFESNSTGSSFKSIKLRELKLLPVKLPSLKEQKKIATYLSAIDAKIERVNQQITQTQTFKKGLLQQMFV